MDFWQAIVEAFDLYEVIEIFWIVVNIFVATGIVMAILLSFACAVIAGMCMWQEFKGFTKKKSTAVWMSLGAALVCGIFGVPIILIAALTA